MKIHLVIHTSESIVTENAYDPGDYEIGRNPNCPINFGSESVEGVSWKHARIEWGESGWSLLDLGSTNGTFLNGQRLNEPTILNPGDEARFGLKGPRFTVQQIGEQAAPAPEPPAAPTSVGSVSEGPAAAPEGRTVIGATRMMLFNMQDRLGQMQGRNRRLMAAVAALVVVGACTVGGILWSQHTSLAGAFDGNARHEREQQELKHRMDEEVAQRQAKEKELEQKASEARALAEKTGHMLEELENNKATIARKNSDAVYFVVSTDGRRTMSGTAFAISGSGTFGTNAHIAGPVRANLAAGGKAVLVSQGGKHIYPIKKAVPHAGYEGNPRGPDVGLLYIDLPAGEQLPCVAELASQEDLKELSPGAPLMYIGFPVFNDADYAGSLKKVDARVFTGTLNRLLTFSEERGEFATQQWLEHDIISWHGASGSPVFNHHGKVVALINSGFSVNGVDTAANPNKGAVRVDLLRDLLAATR